MNAIKESAMHNSGTKYHHEHLVGGIYNYLLHLLIFNNNSCITKFPTNCV
jgi:hypothetical protein